MRPDATSVCGLKLLVNVLLLPLAALASNRSLNTQCALVRAPREVGTDTAAPLQYEVGVCRSMAGV